MTLINPLDFPAADGRPVTEAHARYCADRGHAAHVINGVTSSICPRCGDERRPSTVELKLAATRRELDDAVALELIPATTAAELRELLVCAGIMVKAGDLAGAGATIDEAREVLL